MYKLIKPLLFKIEPEKAHGLTVDALKFTQKNAFLLPFVNKLFTYEHPSLSQNIKAVSYTHIRAHET